MWNRMPLSEISMLKAASFQVWPVKKSARTCTSRGVSFERLAAFRSFSGIKIAPEIFELPKGADLLFVEAVVFEVSDGIFV